MSEEIKELFVREIVIEKSGSHIVIGVSNNGATIRVGDIFTRRYDAPQTVDEILNEVPRPTPTNENEVAIIVSAIEWPKSQQATELPPGHYGALQLTGSGVECIEANCFLKTQDRRD